MMARWIISKQLLLLSLLFIFFHAVAQNDSSSNRIREEIRSFFSNIQPLRDNLYITNKPIKTVSRDVVKIYFPKDTLFSEADLDFIKKQAAENKILLWDSSLIDERILIKDSLTKRKEWYVSYSIPLFSLDYQTCIILVDLNCNLGLCGNGFVLILRKRNGIWEIVDGDTTWFG